jgi:hypothetical protein
MQKRQLELWKDVGIEFHVEIYLKEITNYAFDIPIYVIIIVCGSKQRLFLNKLVSCHNSMEKGISFTSTTVQILLTNRLPCTLVIIG